MFDISDNYLTAYKALSRRVNGSVVCQTDNGVVNINPNDSLVKFTIEKTSPNGKMFGFAVSQKITIETLGVLNNIKKGNRLIPSINLVGYENEHIELPYFYVDTVDFNKVRNTSTIVGYDILHKTNNINIGKLSFTYPMYSGNYVRDILDYIGGNAQFEGINFLIRENPKFDGSESIHTALTAFAEFTGTICYVSHNDNVRFRGMTPDDFTDVLTADDYFNLSVGEPVRLTKVGSANELGDNIYTGTDGFTQVLWENPFMDVTTSDATTVLTTIGNFVRNLTSIDYNLEWRGCPAYELGDYVILQEKDGTTQYALYFNEVIEYNGGLKARSEWAAGDGDNIEGAPSTIGATLKVTSAKVDKFSQEISLLAEKVEQVDPDTLLKEMAGIKLTTDSITSSVESLGNELDNQNDRIDGIEGDIENLSTTLEQTVDKIKIEIKQEIVEEGVTPTSITTTTGFTFNEEGLTIEKKGSDLTTRINEDGLTIYSYDDPVMIVDHIGVQAKNLHATTYLIIGLNSRFEDYNGDTRTGCFWIGE